MAGSGEGTGALLASVVPADRGAAGSEDGGAPRQAGAPGRRTGRKPGARSQRRPVPAASLPVARVAVDMPLAHLDRPFDYQVPESMSDTAVPGCRVRVRFAGQLASGFVLGRAASSEHLGRLAYLERVVSPEPVLTPEIAGLARAVADRYAGTLADVLRLAVPPRHGRAEAGPGSAGPGPGPPGAGLAGRARSLAPGRVTGRGGPSWRPSPTAVPRVRSGLRCQDRTGRTRSR